MGKTRGRKPKDRFVDDRLKVLSELYKRYVDPNNNETTLEHADVKTICDADKRTALPMYRDISDFCTSVRLYERGIQADRCTFYRSNMTKDRKVKGRIGYALSELLDEMSPDGLAFGPGSSITISSEVLAQQGKLPKVIISNSLGVYEALRGHQSTNLILTGGEYKEAIHAFVGDAAVEGFRNVHCEACVMGVSAVNTDGELLVKFPDEPSVLKQMLLSTTETIFIVTSAKKFVSRDTFPVTRIDELLKVKNVKVKIIANHYSELDTEEMQRQAREVADALTKIDDRIKIIWVGNKDEKGKRRR